MVCTRAKSPCYRPRWGVRITCYPWNGLRTPSHSACPRLCRASPGLLFIFGWRFHSAPPLTHSTLLPKSAGFHIFTLGLHVCQTSSARFFLSSAPWNLTRSFLAVYLTVDGHGLTSYALPQCPHPCTYIASWWYPAGPLCTACISLSSYTLEWTRYGTYTSIWYVLNCSFGLPYICSSLGQWTWTLLLFRKAAFLYNFCFPPA